MQLNEDLSPLPIQNRRLEAIKGPNPSPCLRIPASPFMKHLGYGTGKP